MPPAARYGRPAAGSLAAALGPLRGRPNRPSHRRFVVRRVVTLTVVLAVLSALGGTVYAVSRPGSTPPDPRRTEAMKLLAPPQEPGGGRTLFPSHRLVAFYGSPGNPVLGVLGEAPPGPLWSQLNAAAAAFTRPGTVVVPSYELVAFGAESAPGPDDTYSAELPAAQITSYLQVVRSHGGMLILDIQPGRASLLTEAEALEPWLVKPDVGLALDPEWELGPGQVPEKQVGHTTATEINQVSAWLQQLTVAGHLPQKLLMIHQFLSTMIVDKPAVIPQPALAMAFNMDGFGPPDKKISVYQLLASDPRWALGYKLFYARDQPLQTPADLLTLVPPPRVVEYE